MNRKDIALTVVGVLATAGLTYLLYRKQQNDSAAATAAASTSNDVTDPNYYGDQGGLYDESLAYQMGAQSAISVPSLSATTGTSSTDASSSVDTSASTASTGSEPTTDANDLISQIIQAYAAGTPSSSSTNQYQQTDFSGLSIPTATVTPAVAITGIPTTAAQAAQDAENMLGINGNLTSSTGAVNPPSITPVATTSRPTAHPILAVGS